MIEIILPGQPIPKLRARTFKQNGVYKSLDPQHSDKIATKWRLKERYKGLPLTDALEIDLHFYFRPVEGCKDKKDKIEQKKLHTQKPDLDNLEKYILDCCNKILYEDDSQIVKIKSSKQWAEQARTEIRIKKMEIENVL